MENSITLLLLGTFIANIAIAHPCTTPAELAQMQVVKHAYIQHNIEPFATRGLKKYFDKDAKCVQESGEMCNLDFDPLYDSQDPPEYNEARITYQCQNNRVVAHYFDQRKGMENINMLIEFPMRLENNRWRIDDALYNDPHNLNFGLHNTLRNQLK